MQYQIIFEGRQNGAIGVLSVYSRMVEATDPEAARMRLYDTHEHIRVLSCEPAPIPGQEV